MTDPRRFRGENIAPREAAGSHELAALRASDAPLSEFVRVGGFFGFTPKELFPEEAA